MRTAVINEDLEGIVKQFELYASPDSEVSMHVSQKPEVPSPYRRDSIANILNVLMNSKFKKYGSNLEQYLGNNYDQNEFHNEIINLRVDAIKDYLDSIGYDAVILKNYTFSEKVKIKKLKIDKLTLDDLELNGNGSEKPLRRRQILKCLNKYRSTSSDRLAIKSNYSNGYNDQKKDQSHELDVAVIIPELGIFAISEIKTSLNTQSKNSAMDQLIVDYNFLSAALPGYDCVGLNITYNKLLNMPIQPSCRSTSVENNEHFKKLMLGAKNNHHHSYMNPIYSTYSA